MQSQTNGKIARIYLRASTGKQDAERAKDELLAFAKTHNLNVVKIYSENYSGRKLNRPVLNELLDDCGEDEILLVESIDRLTRLTLRDWGKLKAQLLSRNMKIVALTVPTTHIILMNETASRIMTVIMDVIIEVLADAAEQDYLLRSKRSAQGMKKAVADGKMKGRKPNIKRYEVILTMRNSGVGVTKIRDTVGCSINTVYAAINWDKIQPEPMLEEHKKEREKKSHNQVTTD